ncbi:ribonuclease H-like domain-containing protein [Lentinula raphanica]|nr:ribonuclease H-like domain-containing protein [Lentinula raphanica]
MASILLHTTRYIKQYLKTLIPLRGLRYITLRPRPIQEEVLGSNPFSSSISLPESPGTSSASETPKIRVFELPKGFRPIMLHRHDQIDAALNPLVDIIERDPLACLHLSMDAEWNIRRRVGVSILQLCPHRDPTVIYIIPVHRFSYLPHSLLRLLTSERVWKIGSHIKADLTRLRKQFPDQLDSSTQFSIIDLKTYAIIKGILQPKQTGTLASLCESVLGMHLPKDPDSRANNNWEYPTIPSTLLRYAACDVLASRTIFEKISAEATSPSGLSVEVEDEVGGVQVLAPQEDVELFRTV